MPDYTIRKSIQPKGSRSYIQDRQDDVAWNNAIAHQKDP